MKIAGKPFSVHGDNLVVVNPDGYDQTIPVTNPNTWVMLLAKNPKKIIELRDPATGQLLPHAAEYQQIAKQLHLLDHCESSGAKNYRNRSKYKFLQGKGQGFLFSTRPPPHLIPSDPQGVLRELQKAVAEFRAGNESMRNIIVPLAQQAQRMKILPKNLLPRREFTWVYA